MKKKLHGRHEIKPKISMSTFVCFFSFYELFFQVHPERNNLKKHTQIFFPHPAVGCDVFDKSSKRPQPGPVVRFFGVNH